MSNIGITKTMPSIINDEQGLFAIVLFRKVGEVLVGLELRFHAELAVPNLKPVVLSKYVSQRFNLDSMSAGSEETRAAN